MFPIAYENKLCSMSWHGIFLSVNIEFLLSTILSQYFPVNQHENSVVYVVLQSF